MLSRLAGGRARRQRGEHARGKARALLIRGVVSDDAEERRWAVLVNDEGQYSLWPAARAAPPGWTVVRPRGTRAECLAFVTEHWTDMRPASLRRRMGAA